MDSKNPKTATSKPLHWCKDNLYHSEGRRVIVREYFGDTPDNEPTPRFIGVGVIMLGVQHPNGQVQQIPREFEFPIGAQEVREAFMRWDATYREAAKKEGERLQREHEREQQRLVIAKPGFAPPKELKA